MRSHALVVSRNPAWPARAGGRMRDWQNILALSRFARVSAISLQGGGSRPPERLIGNLESWHSLDSYLLENSPSSQGSQPPLPPEWWRYKFGHPSDHLWNPFRHQALERIARNADFTFALIEDEMLWRYADAIREVCPIVIDCHNIQSRLDYEHAMGVPWRLIRARRRRILSAKRMAEIETHLKGDRFLVCSETDANHLLGRGVPASSIAVVGNTVNTEDTSSTGSINTEISDCRDPIIFFPGVLNYPPNVRAALFLIKKILPRVRLEIPQCRLLLVGMSPTFEVLQAAFGNPHVFITGEVADTAPYFRASTVMSVPLREGGGTRFKILEAFQMGLPVVSTTKGCEGLNVANGEHLLIADELGEHARLLVQLIRSPHDREALCQKASRVVKESYSFETSAAQMKDAIDRFMFQWAS